MGRPLHTLIGALSQLLSEGLTLLRVWPAVNEVSLPQNRDYLACREL